ncbi:hypothetical protein [Variovorax guangxiensis]|uniref:hypothetical protein n=1 Tax=Variovorax guangxiensis TaxID=1775474 RepID=UPI0011264F56|nr:hypothetical protein [Variovorax guangxiensis]
MSVVSRFKASSKPDSIDIKFFDAFVKNRHRDKGADRAYSSMVWRGSSRGAKAPIEQKISVGDDT